MSAAFTLTGIPAVIFLASIVGLMLLELVAGWKMYEKMGMPGWKILIPIYGEYVLFREVWNGKAFWGKTVLSVAASLLAHFAIADSGLGLAMCSVVLVLAIGSIVINVLFLDRLSRSFGHGKGFTVLGLFLSPIYTMILGFGKDTYVKCAA